MAGLFDNLGSYNARAGKSIHKEVLHISARVAGFSFADAERLLRHDRQSEESLNFSQIIGLAVEDGVASLVGEAWIEKQEFCD